VAFPFFKVTVPVAAEGETDAVSVTLEPTIAFVTDEARVVVVGEVIAMLPAAEVLAR
jgi:hypothetical protein